MEKECVELISGRLRLSVESFSSSIILYWDDVKLTKDHGFISIVGTVDCGRYYSDKALWQASKISDDELNILLKWSNLPMVQLWKIVIKDEKTIGWKVSIIPTRKINLREQEVGLMLSPDYTSWINSSEEGALPEITLRQKEWTDMQLKNLLSKSVGVRGGVKNGSYKPTVILDFENTKLYTEPEIRNSHFTANLRGLLVLVKPDGQFRYNLINKKYDIFTGEIKLIDSDTALANHIEFCKRQDQKRFVEQLYLRNQSSYKELFIYLLLRFKEHYRNKGFLYAVYRGIKYIIFCLRTNQLKDVLFDILRFKRQAKKRGIAYKLELGRLRLLINTADQSINIYWDGVRLTEYCGFITVIGNKAFKRYYSPQATWKLESASNNQVNILLSWPWFPVEQKWRITLEGEKTIKWDIWVASKRKTVLAEKEVGIMLLPDYTHWINSYEEGEFPEIKPEQKDWQDMKLWNLSSKSIGVRGCKQNKEFMPAIILDYEGTKEDTEPKIRNSDYRSNLRTLLVQVNTHIPLKRYSPDKLYEIFSGKIRIMDDEKLVDQHILNCKKRLYRERLPFIEEKMPRRYLSRILKPVDVLLVNLPWKEANRWGVRAGSRWPHIKTKGKRPIFPFHSSWHILHLFCWSVV